MNIFSSGNELRHKNVSVSPVMSPIKLEDPRCPSIDYSSGPTSTSSIIGNWCAETNGDIDTQVNKFGVIVIRMLLCVCNDNQFQSTLHFDINNKKICNQIQHSIRENNL